MEKRHWVLKVFRKLCNCIPSSCLTSESSWNWLRFYPFVIPAMRCFEEWNDAENIFNYQNWINQNHLSSLDDWHVLQQKAYYWKSPPKLNIVTPVHNTDADVLYECILSVRAQAYPYWQFILVDDGSTHELTHQLLASSVCDDPRIQVYYCEKSQGISKASNLGIEKSKGDYVIFLDHDDRLSLDALFEIAEQIQQNPDIDIVSSDRDMISPGDKRHMHLFKPHWSPETLLSGNYIFHLMCYRRRLLNQLGGLRSEFDGSQDYDLILRAAETKPVVRHIAKVLYHWRQYQGSVSLDSGAKDYAFEAGVKALDDALQRRGISGYASEINSLWRGNYQLNLTSADIQKIEIITIDSNLPTDAYSHLINQSVNENNSRKPFIALISQSLIPDNEHAITQLAAWLQIPEVGLVSGSIISVTNKIEYAGATYDKNGGLLIPYQGSPLNEAGYMAVTKLSRNISAPHPFCVLIRRELWDQLNGLNLQYAGFYSLLDFALRAQALAWRCVSVPQVQFLNQESDLLKNFPEKDKQLFLSQWQLWLEKGDPYYNINLNRTDQDKLYYPARVSV